MSSINTKDISKSLSETIKKDGHPLDLFVKRIVNKIINEYIVPWFTECLVKYTEDDFHKKMHDETFDFVYDWQMNHPKKLKAFIFGARRMRYSFDYNSNEITNLVVDWLKQSVGWCVDESEWYKLYYTIDSIRSSIYE